MGERPVRLRLSRKKGFDLQALSMATNGLPAVKVDRSTRWGNPFHSQEYDPAENVRLFRSHVNALLSSGVGYPLAALRSKNLACWCKPGEPCHADVLLELANPSPTAGEER